MESLSRVPRVLRRLLMASLALGLVFAMPNIASAQTPRFEPSRLPWQTTGSLARPKAFDASWMRVVVDTQLLLRRFSTQYPIPARLDVNAVARSAAARAIWNVRPLAPQPSNPTTLNISSIRATFAPVAFTSGVAAESRTMEGTLVGVKFELLD